MRKALLVAVTASTLACLMILACSDADVAETDDAGDTDAATKRDGTASLFDTGNSFENDAKGPGPSPTGCPPVAPPLPPTTGPRACGALDFGRPATPFVPVDASSDAFAAGGGLAPGIYDVVTAERASGASGSWRETIVVGNDGRFTRTRQIDTGSGPGPVSYRSGKLSVDGGYVTLAEDCYVVNDASAEAGSSTLPYNGGSDSCGNPGFSYSVTGFRFTFEPRR